MAINSTKTAYSFGQLGSVYTKAGSASIKPPLGKVFVAVTCLSDTLFTKLTSDVHSQYGTARWADLNTKAHGVGDHEDADTHNDNGNNDDRVITVAADSANIKKGMIVEHETMCPSSLTDPYKVVSVSREDITLNKTVAGNYATGSTAQKAQFYHEFSQGFGGDQLSNTLPAGGFAKGITIFGRYTEIDVETGAVVAYIGE